MKKHLTILLLTCLLCAGMQGTAQWFADPTTKLDDCKLMVTYQLTYREDTAHFDRVGKEEMVLCLGNEMSCFESFKNFGLRNMLQQKEKEGVLMEWAMGPEFRKYVSRFNYRVFKNYPSGKMTVTDKLPFSDYSRYEEDLNPFVWEIMDDTLRIGGYLAQKAVCDFGGRTWEAWFTDELPFNDGPYKFNGLPGLILNIADTENHYVFEFLFLKAMPDGTPIEWEEKDFIKTTKKAFLKAEREIPNTAEYGDRFDDKTVARILSTLQSRNNPIERK